MISPEKLSHNGGPFDYIQELRDYLWRFVRVVIPGASGSLSDYVDTAVMKVELERQIEQNRTDASTKALPDWCV